MRKIGLLEAIVLSIPIALSGCSKVIDPLGTKVNNEIEVKSGYSFNLDNIYASVKPKDKQYSKVEASVNGGEYEELTNNEGTYTKTITSANNGEYEFNFKITSGATKTEKSIIIPVYLDENQSDTAIDEALSVLVNSSPAVNDIKNYQINYSESGKTWDARILIEKGSGNTGFYFVDCQGSDSESIQTINPYVGAGYNFFTPNHSAELKQEITNHLLDQKSKGWPTITSW